MKQVNRKFLEEQVKSVLKEVSVRDGMDDFFTRASSKDREKARETLLGIGTFIKAMAIGADQSYEDVATYLKDMQMYGLGDTKYITKVLDEIPSLTTGKNAGLNQTTLRFLDVQPFSEASKVSLSFRSDIVDYLIGLRDYYVPRLSNADKPAQVVALLKMMLLGSSYSDGVDEAVQSTSQPMSLKQAASKYAFEKSGTSIAKILQNDKMPEIPADKEVWREVSEKNLERYVDYILKSKDMNNSVERLIMTQFTYLRNLTFSQAFVKMATESNLPNLLLGALTFKYYSQNTAAALSGAVDIFLSLGTTIAAVGTGGLSLMATTSAKAGLKKLGITAAAKWAQTAGKITKKSIESVKAMSTFKAQMLPLGYLIGDIVIKMFMGIADQIEDLEEILFSQYSDEDRKEIESVGYFSMFADKTSNERSVFYKDKIDPLVRDIVNMHATAMTKYFIGLGLDSSLITEKISLIHKDHAFGETFRKNILNMDQESVKVTINQLKSALKQNTLELGELSKKISLASKKTDVEIGKANTGVKVSNNISKKSLAPAVPSFGKAKSQVATNSKKDPEKTSGEALKDIQSSFGSDEKSSAETLRDIQKAFGFEINEETSSQVVAVNIGRLDAIEYAKGNKEFSADKTKNNIDKIAALISNKGKKVNITPVAKMTDDIEGVDKSKFNDFITDINSHIRKNKYSSMTASVQPKTELPGEKPTEKKTDAKQLPTDNIIIVGDSNSMPFSKRWFKRGKNVKRKDGVYLMDGDNIVSPSVSGGTVPTILSATKTFFQQKGVSYKPSIAIVHMGYNAPGGAFPAYQNTINFLKEKGVQDIRVIDVKVAGNTYASSKAGEKAYTRSIQKVSEKIRALSGVTVIANNEQNNIKGDKIHFTTQAYNELYNAAMSGVSSTPANSTTKPADGSSSEDLRVSNPRATEMISDVQKYLKRELTADESENLNKIYDAAVQNISYVKDKNAWNAIRRAYGKKESGNNYNPYKSTGSWKKNRYTGRYAIGPEPYEIARKIVSRYGISMPNYKFINSRKWSEGSQEKYYNDPIAQEASFLGFISHNKKMVANQVEDAKDELSLPGIAHNVGPGAMKRWAQYRTQYRKTKDEQYLYKMWSLQDGNGTPGENFMRILLRQAGSKTPDLPMGFYWSGGSEKNDYKHLEKIKQFDSDLGNFIEENYTKNWKWDARIFAFSEGNYAEKLWNWVTTSGQNTFAGRNTKRVSTNIKDYYNENGDPIGSPEGEFSVGVAGTAAVSATGVEKDPILKTKDSEQTSPEDIKKSGEGFEKALANLREADSYKSFADFFFDIFGLTAGFLDSTNKNMSMVLPEIKNSDLTSFRDKRISFLKDTIHKTNMGTWRGIYKNDIKNAAGDENKIEQAEKKMAYFHRPMFIVRLILSGLDMFGKSRITFSFEPGSGRIGVNFDGSLVFYKQDFQGSNNLNQFLDILKKYAEASRVVGEKSRALLEEEPENSENIQVYVRFSEIFSRFVDSTIETLSSSSASSLRKAYSIFVLDRAFVELR